MQIPSLAGHFSDDFFEARKKFRAAARNVGWTLTEYPLQLASAATDTTDRLLSCDVAITEPQVEASCALIVSSGLHGVEGFLGSAVQHAWLTQIHHSLNLPTVRTIFVHALNPYGFAWLRRCDAENIDVNRNFMLRTADYHGHHPLYERLDELINPRCPPASVDFFWLQALLGMARYGRRELSQAIAEGQYDFPEGLFFGGQHASWTHQLLAQNLNAWIGSSSLVVHIDFHTGLGPWNGHQLLLDYTPTTEQRQWLEKNLAGHGLMEVSNRAAAYSNRGGLGAWCQHQFPQRNYIYFCAEFGTYSGTHVLQALRRENQAHHFAAADDLRRQRAKQALMKVFCPPSANWRQQALQGGLDLIAVSLRGLSEQ